jgi:hypothetical protein
VESKEERLRLTNLRANIPETFPAFVIAIAQDLDVGTDDLWFTVTPNTENIHVGVNCNDFFEWATAEGEGIEPGDRELLIQTALDLEELDRKHRAENPDDKRGLYPELHLFNLFAARKRNKRPQGAWLHNEKYCPAPLVPLFEAVGDERPADLWNPVKS